MRRQPPESREVSLGPGIPRVTLEPLDLPAAKPITITYTPPSRRVCPACEGSGSVAVGDSAGTIRSCNFCDGSGWIGGER